MVMGIARYIRDRRFWTRDWKPTVRFLQWVYIFSFSHSIQTSGLWTGHDGMDPEAFYEVAIRTLIYRFVPANCAAPQLV